MATKTEIERKYEVPTGFVLPDLTALPEVASVGEAVEHRLDATYFDTSALSLGAHQVTLRRRTGGDDAGWHIKRSVNGRSEPGTAVRTEEHFPLTGRTARPPKTVRRAVRGEAGSDELGPVARIRTRRLERPLRDRKGRVLALIADDQVSTSTPGERALLQQWRELEVELVDGRRRTLDAVDRALRAAGARPAESASKLARALAGPATAPAPAPASAPAPAPAVATPTGDPLHDYVIAQLAVVRATTLAARGGDPDGVHQQRVAIRRLRSTLRTFRPLLDREAVGELRTELQWLSGLLGAVRDGHVMAQRLLSAVAAEPVELVVGPVASRIRSGLAAGEGQAQERLVEGLDSPRHTDLLNRLDRFVATDLAGRRSGRRLRALARHAVRRADQTLADALATRPDTQDPLLHEARKEYKQARYAVEVLRPLAGARATRLARRLTELQDVLGIHQDTVVVREWLRAQGMRAYLAGENAFTYGLLHARAAQAGDDQLGRLPQVRRAAQRPKVRRWLAG